MIYWQAFSAVVVGGGVINHELSTRINVHARLIGPFKHLAYYTLFHEFMSCSLVRSHVT